MPATQPKILKTRRVLTDAIVPNKSDVCPRLGKIAFSVQKP